MTMRHTHDRMKHWYNIVFSVLCLWGITLQAKAVDYKPYQMPGQVHSTYVAKGIYVSSTKKQPKAIGASASMPTASFSSTSSYANSLNLNEGVAALNASGGIAGVPTTSGPRKVGPGTPDEPGNPDDQQINTPIGDAFWPLLLMAMVFGGILYFRRRKLTH